MTKNQVDWINAQENIRSNKAKETETSRANRANEFETNRSNLAREKETNRHNVATESLDLSKLNETIRSNKAQEYETNRANVARENENHRHNTATESIDLGKLNETIRSNQANEFINLAKLQEQQRSNLQNEAIGRENATSQRIAAQARADKNDVDRLRNILDYEIKDRKLTQDQKIAAQKLEEQIREFDKSYDQKNWELTVKIIGNITDLAKDLFKGIGIGQALLGA